MAITVPRRNEAIMVRLSAEEKDRLVRAAIKNDQRVGQLARRIINATLEASEGQRGGPGRDAT